MSDDELLAAVENESRDFAAPVALLAARAYDATSDAIVALRARRAEINERIAFLLDQQRRLDRARRAFTTTDKEHDDQPQDQPQDH